MAKSTQGKLQRPPAEVLYANELKRLAKSDKDPRPPGWNLSLAAVRRFVLGDSAMKTEPKFVGNPSLVDRSMVTLATGRGLMLIGEPGTAKSLLSELLAAAISGHSTRTIQGGASVTEDQIKYSWNYALLVAEGPSPKSLVPAPMYTGMKEGGLVRFEEITRCPLEVQDALLSLLSDRVMSIPELEGSDGMLFAREGFNLIATANTRDKGVNDMSAALKRRLNFETVHPIQSFEVEMRLVRSQVEKLMKKSGIPVAVSPDMLDVLVTTFRELRSGRDGSGNALERLSTVMSTAEAVSVAHSVAVRGWYLRGEEGRPADIVECLEGTAAKGNAEDLKKIRRYLEQRAKKKKGAHWQEFYAARDKLGG